MGKGTVILDREDKVGRITLNRPDAFNAFNRDMGEDLLEVMEAVGRDAGIRAVVFTGSGKAFCAGGDVLEMHSASKQGTPSKYLQMLTSYLHPIVVEMRRMQKPIIGVINGVAAGAGFSLALSCDVRICSQSARFTMAYTKIGLIPDGGSTFFLPRIVGPTRAADLILLNPVLKAQEALQWGLVSKVVEDGELEAETQKLAKELSEGPTKAYGLAKDLLYGAWDRSLEAQLEAERRTIMVAATTDDFKEGSDAFANKRDARFEGK